MRTRWVEGYCQGTCRENPGGWSGTARGPVMRTQVGGAVLPGALS